jgi:hypothetical protein
MDEVSSASATSPTVITNHDENSFKSRCLVLETLFDAFCAQPAVVHHCENCVSETTNLDAKVSIFDSERTWNVFLTVCPKCDQEQYLKFISKRAALSLTTRVTP